jgi:arsenite methyltransferase
MTFRASTRPFFGIDAPPVVAGFAVFRLPLEDASVDLVLANLAIHNLRDRAKRESTIREAARVLRPGGTLAVVDFTRTAEYARDAAAAGLSEVDRSGLRWSLYPPVRVVTARKPRR